MKPQTFAPTPIAAKGRSYASVTLLAGLLVLAAILIGAIFVLGRLAPVSESTSYSSATRSFIAHCRACRDEALTARQGLTAASGRSARPGVVGAAAHTLIANCRACRDEALAARPRVVPTSGRAAPPVTTGISTRTLIANCRACRAEALGDATIGASAADESSTQLPFIGPFRQSGPR